MDRPRRLPPELRPATAAGAMVRGATAAGATAVGAAAVGAVAVGAAAIGRLAIGRAAVKRLQIDELVVGTFTRGGIGHADVAAWIDRYEGAWRTAGTDQLTALFTERATYRPGPFEPTVVGRAAISAFWEAERESAAEPFDLRSEIVAVEGERAVARVEVDYHRPQPLRYRNLWVITFDGSGRCTAFEEWPFAPDRPVRSTSVRAVGL